jgi:membrane-associated phospholipid phosphatase
MRISLEFDRDHPLIAWVLHHWVRATLFVFGCIVPLLVFAEFAEDLVEHETFWYDRPVLEWLHARAREGYDQLMVALSIVGFGYGIVPLDIAVGLFFIYRRRWTILAYWVTAVGGAAALNVGAKLLFGRSRPSLWESIAPEHTLSFPSGHAMGSMAAMAALVVLLWPTRWRWSMLIFAVVFVLGVGLSRVYLGVHYPSDVLAGWMASLGWVIGMTTIFWGKLSHEPPADVPGPGAPAPARETPPG